ncbi:MAG: hypothetical protein LBD24_07085 [Spirochaetaceae bacterium]|nr:hypothetical protein [Spirochaetaceae bacterium]
MLCVVSGGSWFAALRRTLMEQPEAAEAASQSQSALPRYRDAYETGWPVKPSETARSVAAPGLCKPPKRTGCCTTLKQQAALLKPSETVAPFGSNRRPCCASAAGGVLHHSETTMLKPPEAVVCRGV